MADDPKAPPPKHRTRLSEEIGGILGFASVAGGLVLMLVLLLRGCVPGLFNR